MAGSFAAGAKAEMCRTLPSKLCCAQAACFGILLFCNSFTFDAIRIVTECREFAQILPKLFRRAFDIEFDTVPAGEGGGKLVFAITEKSKLDKIMAVYGFDRANSFSLRVNLPVVEEACCKAAFLRGAFLAGGSVTDPDRVYHLEISTSHHGVARQTYALIHDLMGFYPKMVGRGGGQLLYLKQSELISDLLTMLGAPVAAMAIIETKLEKELNNMVNRSCNCDLANTSKVVEAAHGQVAAIRTLQEKGVFEHLPQKLQEAARARLDNPDASLTELAGMMQPPITKPAMNQRLKKLVQLAKEDVL